MTMALPRLFSRADDRKLLPEALGDERFDRIAGELGKKRGYRCEVTGFQSQSSTAAPHGYMLLEWRQPGQAGSVTTKTVRVVDSLTFWARHVDLAVHFAKGSLIFAPWLDQGDILSIFRAGSIAMESRRLNGETAQEDMAARMVMDFEQLNQDELMLAALGLEGQVERWDEARWLDGLRSMATGERKQYLNQFARHLRFLPSRKAFTPAIRHWAQYTHVGENERAWHQTAWQSFSDARKSLAASA